MWNDATINWNSLPARMDQFLNWYGSLSNKDKQRFMKPGVSIPYWFINQESSIFGPPLLDDNSTIHQMEPYGSKSSRNLGSADRHQTIEEIARQIKAGRAIGVLAQLQDEAYGFAKARAMPTDNCGPLCRMHQLGAECHSSVYASEHLKMFSVTFQAERCTLGDIIFVLSLLTSNPSVDFLEVDGVVDLHKNGPTKVLDWNSSQTLPNDPFLANQWHVSALDLADAWGLFTGANDSQPPIVMVVDTGVDYTHPDLKSNMWQNLAELNGVPGVDDDDNGYIDDIYGINSHDGTGDPMDVDGHGSHCAGTIGAVSNNTRGIAGIHWRPKIMACRFIVGNSGSYGDAIKCIDYALRMGANIITNSWGGGPESSILRTAIQRAASKNILFVISSGNSGKDLDSSPTYPASYRLPNSITVGAIDKNGIAEYSNYGRRSVDIAAPGTSILSTTPNNSYAYFSGTSMAAPIITGLSTLILSLNPTATPWDIKWLLRNTLEKKDYLATKFVWGGVPNAYKLMTEAAGPTFFFPSGGWQSWRVALTTISPRATARIPLYFSGQKSGVERGSLIIRRMKGNRIVESHSINVQVETVAVSQLNVDLIPVSGVNLRAYPDAPSLYAVRLQQRGGDDAITVKIDPIVVGKSGDGIISTDRDVHDSEIHLTYSGDTKDLNIICALAFNDVSSRSTATKGELSIWGPIGLNQDMTKFRVPIQCQAVSLKFDPNRMITKETKSTPWSTIKITKDAKARLQLFYHYEETHAGCENPGSFKKYDIRVIRGNSGFVDLAALHRHGKPDVIRIDDLHGQDDKHVKVDLRKFSYFNFFHDRIQKLAAIFISINGLLSFDNWKTNNDWNPAIDAPVRGEPQQVIAPYWLDMLSTAQDSNSHIYVFDSEDRLIVQWNSLSQYSKPEALFTFQAHLTSPGHVYFSYKDVRPLEKNKKKLNIGLKSGMESATFSVADFNPEDTIIFVRSETRKSSFQTVTDDHAAPIGFLEWDAAEASTEIPFRLNRPLGCANTTGRLKTMLYDLEQNIVVKHRLPILVEPENS
eukprot:Gregarina_sp_Poly_1__10129@NODE_690_length_6749_cov_8_016761_g520_i0_p1_GENE_NODE_690_length_6749_cov_8_016761_g520_i0NODE_690_length_6749_cov_8_016761_g520_i0_p1_ORF_typecomplete_len1133_score139_33Peptidase_S8/PF00082_22/9e64_NODE_690_length_6749_cov_8_016761_g520_i02853401